MTASSATQTKWLAMGLGVAPLFGKGSQLGNSRVRGSDARHGVGLFIPRHLPK